MASAIDDIAARPRGGSANLSRVPYLPGLDGMRALAVIAVMIYHANSEWLPGGFFGVEVFFVISGYLITLLLIAEHERTGSIDLLAFWGRRARRLLPALFVMLFLLLVYTSIFRSSVLGKLRGDMLGGILYVSNWYQIWVGQGYSAAGDFAPLRHLWSLAVEEQFYLLWPIVMLVLLRRAGARSIAHTARWVMLAAVVVTVLLALLYHPGVIGSCVQTPEAYWTVRGRCINKADALYYSTITRSTGVLVGSAFAMVWRPVAIMRGPLRNRGRALDLLALFGLALLALFAWKIHFVTPAGADPWLFRGGFLWTSIASVLMIAAVTHRRAFTGRLLGMTPLLWIGTRSYGLYLFHWPIYQVIRKVAGTPLSWQQFAVAMVFTAIVTELSYTFVEVPIRRGEVRDWWVSLRRRSDPLPRQLAAAGTVACIALGSFGVARVSLADVEKNDIEQSLDAGAENVTSLDELLGTDPAAASGANAAGADGSDAVTQTTGSPGATAASSPDSTTTSTTTTTTTTTIPTEPIPLLALGDSVMLGAAGVLSDRGYVVNAEESRQMIQMVPFMKQLQEADIFGKVVVVHLGTNGPFTEETMNEFFNTLSGVSNVIVLNVRANRPWTAANNALLAKRDSPGDNIIMIDWQALSAECQGSCFAADGIHLSDSGQQYYANLIRDVTGI